MPNELVKQVTGLLWPFPVTVTIHIVQGFYASRIQVFTQALLHFLSRRKTERQVRAFVPQKSSRRYQIYYRHYERYKYITYNSECKSRRIRESLKCWMCHCQVHGQSWHVLTIDMQKDHATTQNTKVYRWSLFGNTR